MHFGNLYKKDCCALVLCRDLRWEGVIRREKANWCVDMHDIIQTHTLCFVPLGRTIQ